MRDIYFFTADDTACFMCGDMVKHGLDQIKYPTQIINYLDFLNIKNSIVVLFKGAYDNKNEENFKILKNNNNTIIIDIIDEFIRPQNELINLYNYDLIDGLIIRVKKIEEIYNFPSHLKIKYIPHHWDIRLQNYKIDHSKINFKPVLISNDIRDMSYLYELNSNNIIDIIHNVSYKNYDEYINLFLQYNIHYNVRDTDSLAYKFKPATKMVTASALGTPLITNYDWAVQDLIPSDYPFLIQNISLDNIVNIINDLKHISKTQWNYSLEILENIKHKTYLGTLLPEYIEFFEQFK